MSDPTAAARRALFRRLLPEGPPILWCPLLTHYGDAGELDTARMEAHLAHISPLVKGYLIPGTTGDGWEMSAHERRQVAEFAVGAARRLGLRVLIGVLEREAGAARARIAETASWLRGLGATEDDLEVLVAAGVCGFAVCPPAGSERSQQEILAGLQGVLSLGLPAALYQLPQVTQNEMSPATVHTLADRFPNLILLKDSSGADRVACADLDYGDIFLVRGAEGDYARWLRASGGPYDGLLLSTANCFAPWLHQLVHEGLAGHPLDAEGLSARLTSIISAAFAVVDGLPYGNRFTNANKAFDHFFAYGLKAGQVTPPWLHAGRRLPVEVIARIGEVLRQHDLMPARGYLE